MGDRIDNPLRGIGILSADILLENITPQGSGLTDSSFSQRAPRPGQATIDDADAKLEPQISGNQTTEVEFQVRRAGLPELEGVGLVFRRTDEQPDDIAWRDRATPNWANHFVAAKWTDVDDFDVFDLVVTQESQQLILLYAEDVLGEIFAKRFEFPIVDATTNPQTAPTGTGTWGAEVVVSVNPNAPAAAADTQLPGGITGVALPNGRVLAFGSNTSNGRLSVYSSDDDGATWDPYAVPASNSALGTGIVKSRAVFYRGDIVVFSERSSDGIGQQGSNSLGTKFSTVVDESTPLDTSVCAVALPNNAGIVLGYIRAADSLPVVRILSSAFQPYTNSTEIEVDPAITIDDMELSADGSGRLFVYGRIATSDVVRVWFSLDSGSTWEIIGGSEPSLYISHDNDARLVNFAVVHCRGWAILAHNWVSAVGNEDGSIGTLWSAGWGSFSNGGSVLADNPIRLRNGWGTDTSGSASSSSQTGIPIELPADTSDWIHAGAVAPTLESPGELEFAIVASNGYAELPAAGPVGQSQTFMFDMKITSGTVDDAALNVGAALRIADGVNDFEVEVRFNNSIAGGRIRVIDVNGATVGDIAPWDTDEVTQFAVAVDGGGRLVTTYRRPWHTRWFQGPSLEASTLVDGGPAAATNRIQFGTVAAATTVTSRWRLWFHQSNSFENGEFVLGVEAPDPQGKFIDIGGLINNIPSPLPEIGDETRAAFLSAQRGPGRKTAVYTVAPLHDFGIDRLFPGVSPSPDEPWRSQDGTAAQRIVFDLGADTRLGPIWHLVFGFFNINVKTVEIDTKTDVAGAFTNIGTYNGASGFEGLTYELTGDTIRPAAGSIDGARFLERNELRGGSGLPSSGFVILDTGGTPSAHRIVNQSAGGWQDPATGTTLLPEIRLDGITGAEAASGLCDIVFASGVKFVRSTGLVPTEYFRYLKIQIPAGTLSPDGFYQIGNLFVGTAAVFGKQNSRGWSQEMRPNTSRRASRYGTIRKRKDGPPAIRWTYGWGDGVVLRKIRAAVVNQNYLSTAAGRPALAATDDVWGLLWGLLEETEGGEVAVLALNSIPSDDSTITDRRRFLFGTWDSSVQFNQVTGDENIGEFGRIDPITVAALK